MAQLRQRAIPSASMRLLVFALAAVLAGCGDDATTPEQQLRALVQSAQDAANAQDTAGLQALVSESYADERGLAKADIDRTLALQMLRGRPYVLLRVQELAIEAPESARLEVLAGLARVPVGGFDEMLRLSADIYLFDLALTHADADGWLVTSARWRPASPADVQP